MNAGSQHGIWIDSFLGRKIIINESEHTISLVNKSGFKITTEYPRIPTFKDLELFKADLAELELGERVRNVL